MVALVIKISILKLELFHSFRICVKAVVIKWPAQKPLLRWTRERRYITVTLFHAVTQGGAYAVYTLSWASLVLNITLETYNYVSVWY